MADNQCTKPSAVKNPIIAGDNDPRHGTTGGYTSHKCRCALCTAANSRSFLRQRAARAAVALPANDPRHGKPSTYVNHVCRCRKCRDGWAKYCRELRARKRDSAVS